jgi:methionine sulfoxide reductase heme-binding subunit
MPAARWNWLTQWVVKPLVFVACLLPVLRLSAGVLALEGVSLTPAVSALVSLGADPVAKMLHTCGKWALKFLLITLCMTPLRDSTHSVFWLRFRRMFGLFAFFYVLLHFTVYLLLDQAGKLGALWQDIVKRPYITIGMLALLLLIPLAVTSTAKAQRRLGRRWTRLHRLIYLIAVLGVWHYWWGVKKDIREPLLYACGLSILLGFRLWKYRKFFTSRFSAVRSATTDVP